MEKVSMNYVILVWYNGINHKFEFCFRYEMILKLWLALTRLINNKMFLTYIDLLEF